MSEERPYVNVPSVKLADDAVVENILVSPHVYSLILKDRQEACEQRSKQWYEKRNAVLTASAVAPILGFEHFETRRDLLQSKLNLVTDAPSEMAAPSEPAKSEVAKSDVAKVRIHRGASIAEAEVDPI